MRPFRTLLLTPAARRIVPVALLLLGATLALWAGLRLRSERAIPVPPLQSPDTVLTLTVLSVGNGEAALVRTPTGKIVVIGAGPPGSEAAISASVKQARAQSIALLLLPYPYAEAIGGASGLLRAVPVERVVESAPADAAPVNDWHAQVRALCKEKNIPLQSATAGDSFAVDNVHFDVLAPAKIPLAMENAGANNSLVVRVRWRKSAFLFMGGVEKAGEEALLYRNPPLTADFLRVSRMGGASATSPELLHLVCPRFVVVSAAGGLPASKGAETVKRGDNPPSAVPAYPSGDALRRASATGAPVWLTGQAERPLIFMSDGARVWASPDNPPAVLIQ